jgi:hypothetical protein
MASTSAGPLLGPAHSTALDLDAGAWGSGVWSACLQACTKEHQVRGIAHIIRRGRDFRPRPGSLWSHYTPPPPVRTGRLSASASLGGHFDLPPRLPPRSHCIVLQARTKEHWVRGTASRASSPRPQLPPMPAIALILYIVRGQQQHAKSQNSSDNTISPSSTSRLSYFRSFIEDINAGINLLQINRLHNT